MIPWIHKYAPKNLNDIVGQEEQINNIKIYLDKYGKSKKPLILYGGIGSGKTSAVMALANSENYELTEMNASDTRNAEAITTLLSGVIKQGSLFGFNKIILIDELEGLSGTKDRGGVQALIKVIENSKYPVIMICEDAYAQKIKPLKKISELVMFDKLTAEQISSKLKSICEQENIKFEEHAINQLSRMSDGDLRAAINDLQILTSKGSLTSADLETLDARDATQSIEDALLRVFKTNKSEVAISAFDNVVEDLDKIFLWVEENLPKEYLEPEFLANGFDALSRADVFYGRIRRWQYYRFYVYCYNLLSVGVALSKTAKNSSKIKYEPSSRILKIWIFNNSVAKKKSIAQKLGQKTHTGSKKAYKDIPFLQNLFLNNDLKNSLIKDLDLTSEEVAWLNK